MFFVYLFLVVVKFCGLDFSEFRIGQQDNSDVYNHTLATRLVEYASAVSLFSNFFLLLIMRSISTVVFREIHRGSMQYYIALHIAHAL